MFHPRAPNGRRRKNVSPSTLPTESRKKISTGENPRCARYRVKLGLSAERGSAHRMRRSALPDEEFSDTWPFDKGPSGASTSSVGFFMTLGCGDAKFRSG